MTAKEYLSQAYYIDRKIKLDVEKLEAMKASLYSRGASYESDGSRHKTSNLLPAVQKVIEYEETINAEIDKLVDKRIEIEATINAVGDEVQREILVRRYLKYQKWDRIAFEMHRDLRWIYRLHGRALSKLTIIDH